MNITRLCSEYLSKNQINVVSGYAKGIDITAHQAALESGGTTTFVLAEGILNFKPKKQVQEYLDDNNYLVISEFWPQTRWFVNNAMQRNQTICALSNVLVLIEAAEEGGSFAAGEKTLEIGRPLVAVDFNEDLPQHQGNKYFLSKGAVPLNGHNDHSNFETIIQLINSETIPKMKSEQPLLWD